MPLHLEHSISELYADGTTVHYSSNLVCNINLKFNSDRKNVAQWYNDNDIVINTQKYKSMLIGSNRKLQDVNCELNIFYEQNLWQELTCEKLLGINIDNCLLWTQHINKMSSIISSLIGLLSRLKTYSYLTQDGLKMYYSCNRYI